MTYVLNLFCKRFFYENVMYVKITVKCIFHKRESTNQHYQERAINNGKGKVVLIVV